ncbi:MAG: AMP-binding protein [Deltaproteobacteria bacterium]|nr:AMP-binding protein [Deltaproteobacteria bacterium]
MDQAYRSKGDTWPKILKYNYEKYGDDNRAMRYKHHGIWKPFTWKDYYHNVKYLALGLLSFGFESGDRALILGDSAPQYYYGQLAVQAIHGVSVGLYSESTPQEIKYFAENSGAGFAIVEDQEQVDKILEIIDDLPMLKKIIYWNYKGLVHYNENELVGYTRVIELGKEYEREHHGVFEDNVEAGKGDDICSIIYTAGTTGALPKGAVHTYKTMRASVDSILGLDPWYDHDNIVPYLPPVWIYEQFFGIGCHLLSGCTLNFGESPETQQRDTRETGPSIIFYGARLWESQAASVQARILGADAIKKFFFYRFMSIGDKMNHIKMKKQKPGIADKIFHFLADIIIFRPIKKSLGLSNARICYSTGAILSPEASLFYHSLNIPLKSLYGSAEGGALSGARRHDISSDTVGPAHRGAEIKTTAEGELIYKQEGVFAGYHNNPEMTAEAIKDGWFHSGDSGHVREDGHIVIVDRMKDVIELAGVERIAPQLIESRLRFSPYITDAWVLAGPNREYLSAIIIINYNNVSRWAGQRRINFNNFAELSQAPEVYELIKKDIDRINDMLPPGARVKKYVNLHRGFDPDEGELTRTRNLRRRFLEERYRELIDAIYDEKTEASIEALVAEREAPTGAIKTMIRIESVEGAVR